jgi:hypothetical protein
LTSDDDGMTLKDMADTDEPTEQEIALEIFRETRRTRRLVAVLVGVVLAVMLGAAVISFQEARELDRACAESRATLEQPVDPIVYDAAPSLAVARERVERFVAAYC